MAAHSAAFDVNAWLEDGGLSSLANVFREEAIERLDQIMCLTESDMRELGCRVGTRHRLLGHIMREKERQRQRMAVSANGSPLLSAPAHPEHFTGCGSAVSTPEPAGRSTETLAAAAETAIQQDDFRSGRQLLLAALALIEDNAVIGEADGEVGGAGAISAQLEAKLRARLATCCVRCADHWESITQADHVLRLGPDLLLSLVEPPSPALEAARAEACLAFGRSSAALGLISLAEERLSRVVQEHTHPPSPHTHPPRLHPHLSRPHPHPSRPPTLPPRSTSQPRLPLYKCSCLPQTGLAPHALEAADALQDVTARVAAIERMGGGDADPASEDPADPVDPSASGLGVEIRRLMAALGDEGVEHAREVAALAASEAGIRRLRDSGFVSAGGHDLVSGGGTVGALGRRDRDLAVHVALTFFAKKRLQRRLTRGQDRNSVDTSGGRYRCVPPSDLPLGGLPPPPSHLLDGESLSRLREDRVVCVDGALPPLIIKQAAAEALLVRALL